MGRTKSFDPDRAVEQAMELFWTNGYAGTTPQQLTEALGIGRGSLYHAFGSKRALYERALRRYYDRETVRLIQVLDGPGPARERLRAALDLVVAAAREDGRRRGCMAANAAVEFAGADEGIEHLVRRIFERQEAAFRSTVEEGQRAGEIDAEADAGELAALFLATINGIRVLALADPASPRLALLAGAALRAL
ncbi:TetR/AcrR family transcriptional regulator [Streptomyces sp. URMC 123]|uniref:TetR/AcrR family transcriptional regulator n=1 Tax=Streptomyces sp. URMC 123 TaxID=3423403 RepID=UPI003F1B915D